MRDTTSVSTATPINPATLTLSRNPGCTCERNPEKSVSPGRLCFCISMY